LIVSGNPGVAGEYELPASVFLGADSREVVKCTAALQEYLNEYVVQTVKVVPLAIRREPKDLYTVGCRSVLFGSALI